jgi:hypothetical protein
MVRKSCRKGMIIMHGFYTPIDKVKEELERRLNNPDLKAKVQEYIDCDLPQPLVKGPRAVLCRDLATPDLECLYFVKQARSLMLAPVVFEGVEGKFVTLATDKLGLVKLRFFDGYDKNKNIRYHYRKLIDIPAFDGKRFCDIPTLWHENLVECHHRLLQSHVDAGNLEIFDDLRWFKKETGRSPHAFEYYKIFFSFFVCHGVQFENYITDESEQTFFYEVIQPAYEFVTSIFGVPPLVVELAPRGGASNPFWWCYPLEVEKELEMVFPRSLPG